MPVPAASHPACNEAPEPVPEPAPSRAPPQRSRWRPWLWLLAILIAARWLLSLSLAPLVEARLSRVLETRVDVGDVSFNPIDAVVTLRRVVVYPAGKPIRAARVRLDVQWLPLLHRSLVLRELTIDSAQIDLEQLSAAGWTLEHFQHLAPTTELPPGWSFGVERIVLRDSEVRLRQAGATDARAIEVTVREAQVSTQRRRASAFGRVPNLRVDAVVDDGRLVITGSSDIRDDGVAISARVDLKNVPLEPLAAYRPAFLSESPMAGRVSARLRYQRDPGRRDRLTGRLRGRRIAMHVPALASPALAIRRMDADDVGIDLLQRRIAIGTLTLHGVDLAVRPELGAPLPLLDGLALGPSVPAVDVHPARPSSSWGWSIAHLAAPSARLVEAEGERALALTVSGDSVSPAAYWSPLRAAIDWEGGTATFDGTLRMTRGFTVQGRLTAHDADAVALARALGPPMATLVQTGRVAADLDVELALGVDDGPPLDVQGTISIGGLWLAGDDPNAFAIGAHAVDLTLAPVTRPTDRSRAATPAELRVASAVVASPYVKLIRTPEGWSSEAAWRKALGDDAERPPAAAALVVSEVTVRDGTLRIADETATPSLVLDLESVSGSLREVRGPAVGVGEFELEGTDAHLGALRLSGARGGDGLRAEVSAPDFALAALAPYFRRAGLPWTFENGRGDVHSVLLMGGAGWTADTTVTLRDPAFGGDQAMLQRSLGMGPAAALAAVYDRHGEIMLRFPLASPRAGDASGLTEAFASGVRDALARPRWTALPDTAIVIAFAPGMTELAPDAERRLAAIAEIMAARSDVVLELRGMISREDRRWFAEQAVAEDETATPGGFSVLLRAVGVRDQRMRIREALAARAAGEAGRLRPDDEAALSALVAQAPPVPNERLVALAAARATRVVDLLADRHRVTVARIVPAQTTAPENPTAVVDARLLPTPGTGPR